MKDFEVTFNSDIGEINNKIVDQALHSRSSLAQQHQQQQHHHHQQQQQQHIANTVAYHKTTDIWIYVKGFFSVFLLSSIISPT